MPDVHASRPLVGTALGLVTSPHALASRAGAEILGAGGSAVDAAIAASAVLAVVYPHMTSVGGDAFFLIHDARGGPPRFLDGAGRAAAAATLDWFRARGLAAIPLRGIVPATVTTPGAVDAWCEAHAAHGHLPLARVLAPAVGHARDGFAATERMAGWTAAVADALAGDAATAAIFLPRGRVPEAGEVLRNPGLARTLEAIGALGRAGFYAGDVGRALARWSRERGGLFTAEDLDAQRGRWREPLRGGYRDVTLYETPPPTQGLAVLEMLNLLAPYDLARLARLGPDHVHLLVQAKMLAYHDRDRVLADPDYAKVPVERLLSAAYADERRRLIDPARALSWDRVPSWGSLAGDTVFVAAADAAGHAVALIQSLYGSYGAGLVAGDTGVVMQNRGAYFSLDPAHPNRVEPGKRPLHTLIASLAYRDGRLWQVFGCMGADGQPQTHLQVYTSLVDWGLDLQAAIEAPRWLSGRFAIGDPRDLLNMEGRFPEATCAELARRGHLVHRWAPWHEAAGHAHGITIDPATGQRLGAADPRSDGAAVAQPAGAREERVP